MGAGASGRRSQRPLRMEGHEGSINAICLTSDGGLLASCSDDGTARVWDTETLELVSEMRGHTQYINCVTITGNDEFVITGRTARMHRLFV